MANSSFQRGVSVWCAVAFVGEGHGNLEERLVFWGRKKEMSRRTTAEEAEKWSGRKGAAEVAG